MKKIRKAVLVRIKHPFLQGLPVEIKNKLLTFGKKISLPKGKVVFRDSEKAERFYLLLKGKVDLIGVEQDVRIDSELAKRVFQTLGAGEVVGWSWVIAPFRWRFDAVVQQDADLFAVDGLRLRRAMEQNHELGYEIYKRLVPIMNERLIASRLKLQMFGTKPFSEAEGG